MENFLYGKFPRLFDSGKINGVHIGSNTEMDKGMKGGHRIAPTFSTMASALLFLRPDKLISNKLLATEDSRRSMVEARVSDSLIKVAEASVARLVANGVKLEEAKAQVADSISAYGFFDTKKGVFVAERVAHQVNDSVLTGLQTPYWNISIINKLFKQPFLRGYAENIISEQGVPNIWADLVQIFLETFEGTARVSSVERGSGEFNTSVGVKNRVGTMLSEIINIVIDYESPTPNELAIAAEPGNILGGQVIGDRDAYANLMLEMTKNGLYYFGSDSFDGLYQIANRDSGCMVDYSGDSLEELWEADAAADTAQTTGATIIKKFNHLIGDIMEDLNFMPTRINVACSPTVYKVLKFVLTSDSFNQNSPLSFISKAFEHDNKIVGTMATKGLDRVWVDFELVPDPMLMPGTPFNTSSDDVMFITFPTWQSSLDPAGLQDVIIAPVPIKNMILPMAPGFRDGTVRTSFTRVGSLLAPVTASVYCIKGFGIQGS